MVDEKYEALILHGLGSSPDSSKAQLFNRYFSDRKISCRIPDLNQPSFEALSPRHLVEFVSKEIACLPAGSIVLGNSFGGYLAIHALMQAPPSIRGSLRSLILLAPALNPWDESGSLLTEERVALWRRLGALPLKDLREDREVPVHYQFVEELQTLGRAPVLSDLPSLIVHGVRDDIVPIAASREYAATAPNVELIECDDDHRLLAAPEELVAMVDGYLYRKL